jgi:hypothetical protein
MSAARIIGAAASLLIHAALFASFAIQPPVPAAEQSTPILGRDDGEEDAMRLVPTQDVAGEGLACDHSYRGIGIAHWSGTLIEVVEGGPAHRAGARLGDVLLNDALFARDEYPIGKPLPLRLQREGQQLELIVYVGRVCYTVPRTVPHLREDGR